MKDYQKTKEELIAELKFLRQRNNELEVAEEKLKTLENLLVSTERDYSIGYWDLDLKINKANWSAGVFSIFGEEDQSIEITSQKFLSYIHLEDKESVAATIKKAIANKSHYGISYRINLRNGERKTVFENAKVILNPKGEVIKLQGRVQDISKFREIENSLRDTNLAYQCFIPKNFLTLLNKKSITEVKVGDQIQKQMTVMFSDIRGFSSISEKLSPQDSFNFINSYLKLAGPPVRNNHGFIDKYIGDSIMAIFDQEADHSVQAGIQILRSLNENNLKRIAEGKIPIKVGVGMNTGTLALGAVGDSNRMNQTVIGDVVNLSSRIESLTKNYGVPLLISEQTFFNLKDPSIYKIRFVDWLQVKGKTNPVSVYEVFDADSNEQIELKQSNARLFEEAVAHYHFARVEEAKEMFIKYLQINPGDQVAKLYLTRCNSFNKNQYFATKLLNKHFEWSNSLELKTEIINEQHQELFSKILSLIQAIKEKREGQEIINILVFLEHYTIEHFAEEEEMMLKYNYHNYEKHKQQHLVFVNYLKNLKEEIQKSKGNRLYLVLRVQIMVIDWMINHIGDIDKETDDFLVSKLI